MRRFSSYLLCLLALACSDKSALNGVDATDVLLGGAEPVSVATRGTGDGKTYIFYLAGNQGGLTQNVVVAGTYADVVPGDPLMPCAVDQDGNASKDADGNVICDSSKGLRAVNGGYRMFIASPAVQTSDVPGQAGLKGYRYERNADGVYVSSPVSVSVGGVYLTGADGTEYVYDASSHVLRQPRSRVKLRFACGSDIDRTTLRSVSLKNFINEGYYLPLESRFHYSSVVDEMPLYTGPLAVSRNEVKDLNVNEYVLSMNYGELDAQGNTKWPMPALEIETGESDSEVVTFNAALGWNFKPQHTYEFTIIINSVYVNMTVTAVPWDVNPEQDAVIDSPDTWQITFPLEEDGLTNLLDWEEVGEQVGTIG